ncbi:MAG: PHP domain-containing protein [Clostridia bacterium]|nr:PHP domain-containing protein [Clostridia bacterium]
MNFYGDYHTHTTASDGISSLEDNVQEAVKKGLKELAVTDHGFANPKRFAMTPKKFAMQREQLDGIQKEYGDTIALYQGIEADLIGEDGTLDLTEEQISQMDVLIMGYHSFAKAKSFRDWRRLYWNAYLRVIKYPSKQTIARNTKAMINAIKRYPIDIVAHLNHLFKVDCYEVTKAAADYGVLIELNAKHFDFSHDLFEKMLTTSANFIVNSDAHYYKLVGGFSEIETFLSQHSFDPARIVNLERKPAFKKR